ncbi:YjgB family protein [Shimazuella sp. AN120528]|uniref:DUF4309 domain-containing protein n=1 Tax=Shimazuella soli TaxID=1892854 RepID=UPI001F0E5FA5|nr:DUF4309 domain-containing protein [Shimazuella soli]MCH5585799.1 YjgB family protein [Shimazuella soli]
MMGQKKRGLIKGLIATTFAAGLLFTGITHVGGVHAANNIPDIQTPANQNHAKLLKHTKELAKQGKVITTEKFGFGIGTPRKDIEAKWGQPTRKWDGESDYDNRSTAFNFSYDKKHTVFWVYTTDKSYKSVSYEETKRILGKPTSESHDDEDKNAYSIVYRTGKYELNFHFYKKKGKLGNIQSVDVVDRSKE